LAYSGEELVMKEMDDKTWLNTVADELDRTTRNFTAGLNVIKVKDEVAVSIANRLREIAAKL
jgi:hypothetical protein